MTRLDDLRTILADVEARADAAELTALAVYLEGMRKKLSVRSMAEALQNNALFLASASGDKETLRNFADFSQYDTVRQWARKAANAPRHTPR